MPESIIINTLKIIDKKNNDQEYKLTIEGLAQSSHTHTISEITDFNSNNFAPATHTHTVSEIQGLNLNGDVDLSDYLTEDETDSRYASINHNHSFAEITSKPEAYTPSTHTHNINQITDLTITSTIDNNTASNNIPTVGAIVDYIDSLAVGNTQF